MARLNKIPMPVDLGFYISDNEELAAQQCINLYPQIPQGPGASSAGALFRTPGIDLKATVTEIGGRGENVFLEELYVVVGGKLFFINAVFAVSDEGAIQGTGPVSMSNNGLVIVIIVPGVAGYFWDPDTGLELITDATFLSFQAQPGGVTSVVYKDGTFIYTTNKEFFLGSVLTVNKGKDFSALDFGTAEINPDDNVRAFTVKNELYIFGQKTIELFTNIGGSGFPFQRVPGAAINKGLFARFGVVEYADSYLFVGGGRGEGVGIWQGFPGTAARVSTPAIDTILKELTDSELSGITAWVSSVGGSDFAGFNLPDTTIVYDTTASQLREFHVWHERQTSSRWRVETISDVYGLEVVTDSLTGKIGALTRNVVTDFGDTVVRTFAGNYLRDQGSSFIVPMVEMDCNSGGALNTAASVLELQYSDDGAVTFLSAGTKSLGLPGQVKLRQRWNSLGRADNSRIFRFIVDQPAEVDFIALDIAVKGAQ